MNTPVGDETARKVARITHIARALAEHWKKWGWWTAGLVAPAVLVLVFVAKYELRSGTPIPRAFAKPPPPALAWLGEDYGVAFWDSAGGAASALTLCGLLAYGWMRRRGWPQRRVAVLAAKLVLVFLLGASVFASYYGRKVSFRAFVHRWDAYHYMLGPKYFDEVEYAHLYDCTVELAPPDWFAANAPVRDLTSYKTTTAAKIRRDQPCAERFSNARRDEFRADLALFRERLGRPEPFKNVVTDQGYNGTPFHTFVAGRVANAVDLDFRSVNLLVQLDLILVVGMFLVVTRTFGWKTGFVFAIFFVTDVIDRNSATGASFLRYLWMFTLTLGVCAVHRKQHFRAGAWIACSAMLNVFPLLFLIGPLIRGTVRSLREFRVPRSFKRFLMGVGVASVLCGAASVSHGRGVDNYVAFFANMEIHNLGVPTKDGEYLEKIPGYGVGLKFPFMYRGQHDKESYFTRRRKSNQYDQIEPYVFALALGFVGVACALSTKLSDTEASVLVGFTVFFCLLGTVGYYFSCVALFVLALQRRFHEPGGYLFMVGLFAINTFGHWALHKTEYIPVVNNTIVSTLWTAWLLALFAYLGYRTGMLQAVASWLAAPAPDRDPPS